MIISAEELMTDHPEFAEMDETVLQGMLDSVELMIRKFTNNNFQNKFIRFSSSSTAESNALNGSSPFLKKGDTIQVTESQVNDGLYVISNIDMGIITVNKSLFSVDHNLVTKVEYPADIKLGVINLMKWEISNRDKVGVKSETISRHSVTYYDQDANNSVMGYPVSLLGFLEPYRKARF